MPIDSTLCFCFWETLYDIENLIISLYLFYSFSLIFIICINPSYINLVSKHNFDPRSSYFYLFPVLILFLSNRWRPFKLLAISSTIERGFGAYGGRVV